jgi:hypothetical protein
MFAFRQIPPLVSFGECFVLLKNRMMVGVAALALAGGTTMAAMPAANAATMRCGPGCVTLASQKFGATDVVAVGPGATGELAAFWYTTSEDFYGQPEGIVHDLYKAGVINQSLNNTYSTDEVYQYEYSPAGIASDKCLAATPGSTAVTLEPCGANASTLWVGLSGLQRGNYMPLMSAALSVKSAMLLTAASVGGALSVTQMNLSTTESDGVTTLTDSPYQMWETVEGVYNSSSVNDDMG